VSKKLYLPVTLLIVFLFYAHTLNYPWKNFDENIIFDELILPMPRNLAEFEMYLREFGVMVYFEASNAFYSSIGNLRCDPIGVFISMFVEMLFQKNALAYHCLSLLLHLINTFILFICLQRCNINILIISLLTLIWSLHPTNVESVLFTCNWPALLNYCLAFTVFYLSTGEEHV
jgi:hypothetical protein